VRASKGEIEDLQKIGQLDRSEYILFNNSDSSSAEYPIDNAAIDVEVVFAYDATGVELDPSKIVFGATHQLPEIRASRPFVGAIKLGYTSTYRQYRYKPESGIKRNASGQLLYANYGTILAFKDLQFATLETLVPNHPDDNAEEDRRKEVYRVVSVAQVSENGAWEKHPTYDSGGFFGDTDAPKDSDTILEYERVHEIGYVSTYHRNDVSFETVSIELEQGSGAAALPPSLEGRFKPATEFQNGEYIEVYNQINLIDAKNGIRSRFGNILITGA